MAEGDLQRGANAVMFCVTATTHFNSMRNEMIRMVPPIMPNPAFSVTLTGVRQILGAIGRLVARTRRIAAVALILILPTNGMSRTGKPNNGLLSNGNFGDPLHEAAHNGRRNVSVRWTQLPRHRKLAVLVVHFDF